MKDLLSLILGFISGIRDLIVRKDRKIARAAQENQAHTRAQLERAEEDVRVAKEPSARAALQGEFGRKSMWILLIPLAGGVSACDLSPSPVRETSLPPPVPVVVDTYCDRARIITTSPRDILTEETSRMILAHDRTVKKYCGDR